MSNEIDIIKLESIIKEAPVFERGSIIPIQVDNVKILERTELIESYEKEGINYRQNLRESQNIIFSEDTALPIFKGDKIRAYVEELGLANVQDRTAYRIELLDDNGNAKAIYKKARIMTY
ncbi:hypothetical protein CL617_05270 [archaeon]|nr:hypothetical protein [archaeon]|tara:strand:- start:3626 stop:3985 length:360 start_codon:yes stop_codon:yes gene_type:complete